MPAQTKFEETKDLQKVVMRTITKQDFKEFEPDAYARSYRKEQVDGVWTVVEEYLVEQGQAVLSVDATTSTEPLETNSIFAKGIPASIKQYWTAWKRNPMSPMLAQAKSGSEGSWWTPDVDGVKNSNFSLFYERWVIGYDSYLAPRIVIRKTILEDEAPDCAEVGLISDPPAGVNVPDGINFIQTSARGQIEGDKWRNTYEWLGSNVNSINASGTAGWDPVVYTPQSEEQ